MTTGELAKTAVDLAGLMKVLGESLYSTRTVAIRELVQNAHDSITRRQIEDAGSGTAPAITLSVEPERGLLHIEDNGAGLTDEEVRRYLATVGAGYTRTLRDAGAGDELIGYFGLGFLSAFVVAQKVEVWTCSYQTPEQPWLFSSRSGESYSLRPAEPRPVGSRVTLELRRDYRTLSDARALERVVARYCRLLSLPIRLEGAEPVNAEPPPWRLPQSVSAL
ncbi:MAG: ATP-binding protein [Myxococcales bacterium]|nr:ATP-binding protein [Myxococcales bacterium]